MSGTIHYTRNRPAVDSAAVPARCGAMHVQVSTDTSWVSCTDCIELIKTGGSEYRPLHVPPEMNENGNGIFLFHDTHHGAGYTLEVVPQTTGNVEITIENDTMDGHIFTLSYLDRADLLRALLHDFHYSPERGGPNDDKR